MALSFTDASTDNVDFGSAAALDNISPHTWTLWMKPAATSNVYRDVVGKDAKHRINILPANGTTFQIFWDHASGGALADDTWAKSNSVLVANTWAFMGGGLNPGTAAFCFHGDLNTVVTDQTASSQAGAATKFDESASNLVVGDFETNFGLGMDVACFGFFDAYLSIAELAILQYNAHAWGNHPNCIFFVHLGIHGTGGTGSQIDWVGGNSGTVTGAAKADHAPIPIFTRPIWLVSPQTVGGDLSISETESVSVAESVTMINDLAGINVDPSNAFYTYTGVRVVDG